VLEKGKSRALKENNPNDKSSPKSKVRKAKNPQNSGFFESTNLVRSSGLSTIKLFSFFGENNKKDNRDSQ
jgi:hypothetical protein